MRSHPASASLQTCLVVALAAVLSLMGAAASMAQEDRFPAQRVVFTEGDPIGAAIEISQQVWEEGTAAAVVLGRVDNFADNLAATPLTNLGPLLYVDGGPDGTLRDDVLQEMLRVHPPTGCGNPEFGAEVTIMGGPVAISDGIVQTLEANGYCVERLFGGSRVETSVEAARRLTSEGRSALLVARTDDWADAATGGALARNLGGLPIVVTPTDSLHPAVEAFLAEGVFENILVLGGTAAISEGVEAQLGAYADNVARFAGPTRDTTAIDIVTAYGTNNPDAGPSGVALVPGFDPLGWTYAFAGASTGQIQLYTQPDVLTETTAEELRNGFYDYRALTVIAPPSVISDAVLQAAEDAVNQ